MISILYRLYTEDVGDVAAIVARYFPAATLFQGLGLWQGAHELAVVVEIIGTRNDLQRIANLAGDIRIINRQSCVIVTWSPVARLDITEETVNVTPTADKPVSSVA